jgi:acyl-CoA thioesterase I
VARPLTTATPTAPASVVYVALGASDAVGVGADDPNTQAYVPILISRLPKGTRALNLGISTIHLHDALTQELPDAIAAHPTLVTIWLVGNDFRDCTPLAQYAADLDTLLTQLHDKTRAQVFVGNTPDVSLLPAFQRGEGGPCVAGVPPAQIRALAQRWNATMNPIIARHGAVLVDLFNSDLARHPDYVWIVDGFHPSSAGYRALADLFWKQITAHHAVPAS